jgi:hypothetical protein
VIEIAGSQAADAGQLAPLMRQADIEEVRASSGSTPLEALERAFAVSSLCFTAWRGDTPLAMFGVNEIAERIGVIWFLGSDAATEDPRAFARLTKYWLKAIQQEFDILTNVVDERNEIHVRWIDKMGFTFTVFHVEHGVEKRPFMEFVWKAPGDSNV